jgi:acyl-CoA reductase-like NAD-dependent aldehyde dehydrogenase
VTSGTAPGIPRHSEARSAIPATPRPDLDAAIGDLQVGRRVWSEVPASERAAILDGVLDDLVAVSAEWVEASLLHKGIDPASPASAEEWIAGPYITLRNVRLLRNAVADIARSGTPRIPGRVRTRRDGRVAAPVFPASVWDRVFYRAVTAEVWMQPGVRAEGLADTQAVAYRNGAIGEVALVLGAGNVSSIGPLDALYKLFVENHVVLYKAHPANDYLGALLQRGMRRLVERGVLRIVYGGAVEGAYLCTHPGIGEIHITGSDKTYEAIVFGDGTGRGRAERRPVLSKRVTAELGNVSPVIVVPGPWSAADLRYHAANLATMLANNAGFNCNAARVIVQHAGWGLRGTLLDALRRQLAAVPARRAYYPGASARFAAFRAAHPDAESYGAGGDGTPPWTLIPGLRPDDPDEICFRTEAFCGIVGETALPAADVAGFLDRAVRFCNERLWGTLNATILVHPRSLDDPRVRDALERAIADLRYGAVSLNHWAAVSYALGTTTWGAYPGHAPSDIQSGTGVVHNALMFSRPEKTVARAPFRAWPTPPWFVTNRAAAALGPMLARFEARPSLRKALGILATAVTG